MFSKKVSLARAIFISALVLIVLAGCSPAAANAVGNTTIPSSTSPTSINSTNSTPSGSPGNTTGAVSTPTLTTSAAALPTGQLSKPVTLLETGSSLLYPLFSAWSPAIHQAFPDITVQTASTGSGTGISQAVSGVVQFGATDAYMSDSQITNAPGIVNIPLAISAQQINYNLPGITTPIKISGSDLAAIYQGTIQYWDDPKLTANNQGVNLPHQKIIPVHRTDGSGDTFLFTQYLSDTDSNWQNTIGFNTSINWPSIQGALGAEGNPGVVQALSQTKYSIGYVGISFLDQATAAGMGTAALKNKAGYFVMPNNQTIQAAASAMVPQTPNNERISLIYAPGANSYPIINYEYVAVQINQSDPATAAAMRTVLLWAISSSGGNASSFLDKVHFLPLPESIIPLSKAQINLIK